jgi:hypothetical protein
MPYMRPDLFAVYNDMFFMPSVNENYDRRTTRMPGARFCRRE